MIVYVDIEHARVKDKQEQWQRHVQRTLDVKYKLEEVSGDHCLILGYAKLSPAVLNVVNARAVLLSGNTTEFQHYSEADLTGLRAIVRESARPTIGFCGGGQMIAETFGARAAAIDESETGDMDCALNHAAPRHYRIDIRYVITRDKICVASVNCWAS